MSRIDLHQAAEWPIAGQQPERLASRALVVFDPAPRASEKATHAYCRPTAPFVAHLIATSQRLPQTLARRLDRSSQAIAAYAKRA